MRYFDLTTANFVVNPHFDLRSIPVEVDDEVDDEWLGREYEPTEAVDLSDGEVQVEFACYITDRDFNHHRVGFPLTSPRAIAFYSKSDAGMAYRLVETTS